MSATIVHVNSLAQAIVTIDPSAEAQRIAAEYEFFLKDPRTQALQADHDSGLVIRNDEGEVIAEYPRIDFAWQKAQERARNRRAPKWDVQKANFIADLSVKRYAAALGVALA